MDQVLERFGRGVETAHEPVGENRFFETGCRRESFDHQGLFDPHAEPPANDLEIHLLLGGRQLIQCFQDAGALP